MGKIGNHLGILPSILPGTLKMDIIGISKLFSFEIESTSYIVIKRRLVKSVYLETFQNLGQ